MAVLLKSESVTVLRLLRLLKPLRTIKALPGLRLLLSVCIVSIEAHVAVQLISNGVIAYIAAPVLVVLRGSMTGRCVRTDALDLAAEALRDATNATGATFERLCALNGTMGRSCPSGMACVDSHINPVFGMRHFDHFGGVWVLMQQLATLDRWSVTVYQVQDALGVWTAAPLTAALFVLAYGVLLLSLMVTVIVVSQELKAIDDEREGGPKGKQARGSVASSDARGLLHSFAGQVDRLSCAELCCHMCRSPFSRSARQRLGRALHARWAHIVAQYHEDRRTYPLRTPTRPGGVRWMVFRLM